MSATVTGPKRLKLTPPEPSEDEIHKAIARMLDLVLMPPAQCTTFPAGLIELTGQQAAKLAAFGMKAGWPDILVVCGGIPYGLEVKKRGGGLSKTRMRLSKRTGGPRLITGQTDMFPALVKAGMRIAVVHSVDEAIKALADWGLPLRARA